MTQYNLSGEDCGFLVGVSVYLLCFTASPNRSVLQIILFTEYVALSALKGENKIIDHIHLATYL